ncbi:hypothetical protein C8J56DRAFT_936335 [Mycena floridula]|nr:hypothetical protein C8J56DRAFT_936335 [Mycena floridula]
MSQSESCALSSTTEIVPGPIASLLQTHSPDGIDELLVSNRVPSHVQELQVREVVAERLQSLHDLDDRINKMRQDLEILLAERAVQDRETRRYRSVIHPIRRLPAEILSEIFLNFVSEDLEDMEADESMSSLHPSSMRWVVSLVCVSWRSVAVSLPKLWSTIRLAPSDLEPELQDVQDGCQIDSSDEGESSEEEEENSDEGEKSLKGEKRGEEGSGDRDKSEKAEDSHQLEASSQFRSTLSRLRIQLQRSASRQLCVSVVMFESYVNLDSHPVLQMLLPTSSRWTTVLLAATSLPKILRSFISSLKGQLPSMSTLHMLIPSWPNDLTSFAECAPMLKTLAGHPVILERYNLPFSQITRYHTSCVSAYDCDQLISFFRLLPNLETLDILCRQQKDREEEDSVEPVPLLSLWKLVSKRSLYSTIPEHRSDKCDLLRLLTVPALQDLDITLYNSTNELQLLLQRSQCSLITLSLELHDVSNEHCIELLREIPSLVSLTLICTQTLAEKFIDTFIAEPSLLPALQALILNGDLECNPAKLVELQVLRPLLQKLGC